MKKFLPLILISLLFSCKNDVKQPEKRVAKETVKEPEFKLTTFPLSEVPDDFIGCTTGLFLSRQDMQDNNLIFINDFGENAIVGINGRQVKFKLKESPQGSNTYIYVSNSYKLTIKITKEVEAGYENSDVEAQFILQHGTFIIKKELVGYSGC